MVPFLSIGGKCTEKGSYKVLINFTINTMNVEQETKEEWIAPEILDLDMDKTSKLADLSESIGNSFGPS